MDAVTDQFVRDDHRAAEREGLPVFGPFVRIQPSKTQSGIEGRDAHAGVSVQPGQTYTARFQSGPTDNLITAGFS